MFLIVTAVLYCPGPSPSPSPGPSPSPSLHYLGKYVALHETEREEIQFDSKYGHAYDTAHTSNFYFLVKSVKTVTTQKF